MKLRNLLFGTMIACAFVACSNDDDPVDNGNGNSNATGKTEFQFNASSAITKADQSVFTVYVINAAGSIVGKGPANEPFEVGVDAEGNMEVVALRNTPADFNPTKKSDLLATVNFSSTETNEETLLQSTAFYSVNIMRGKTNKLGYTKPATPAATDNYIDGKTVTIDGATAIPAYRNVVKLSLGAVRMLNNFITVDGKVTDKVRYANPKFVPSRVFVLNARRTAFYAVDSKNIWPVIANETNGQYLNGVEYSEYKSWVEKIPNGVTPYITNISESNYFVAPEGVKYNYQLSDFSDHTQAATVGNLWYMGKTIYVNENTKTNNPTLLVINGTFSYDAADGNGGSKRVEEANRYYTIKLGEEFTASIGQSTGKDLFNYAQFGLANLNDIQGQLRRNIQYTINLSIKGPGSDNPLYNGGDEKTYLDVDVKLVPYSYVTQNTEID